jgi:hypothetical protein
MVMGIHLFGSEAAVKITGYYDHEFIGLECDSSTLKHGLENRERYQLMLLSLIGLRGPANSSGDILSGIPTGVESLGKWFMPW